MKPEEVKSELIDIYEHAVEYHDGRSDEAVDMAVEALNKQIPKKPLIDDGKAPVCPCCFGVHSKRHFIVASSLTVRS